MSQNYRWPFKALYDGELGGWNEMNIIYIFVYSFLRLLVLITVLQCRSAAPQSALWGGFPGPRFEPVTGGLETGLVSACQKIKFSDVNEPGQEE